MIVSVEDKLENIKHYLRSKGIFVYDLSDGVISDAYIYSEASSGFINVYNMIRPKDGGSFIINADGKKEDEILYYLNHRTYSSLF